MPRKKTPSVAILHYSCPPVIGGVEFVIEAHAKLFADAGYKTKMIVGNGKIDHRKVKTVVIPEIDSTGGPIGGVVRSLIDGKVPASFESAVKRVEKKLEAALKDVDVCMMHNVLTMHFNLVLNAALANIMQRSKRIRFIGWTHDATFNDKNYSVHHRNKYPWDLLKQKLPGCDYCVISEQRQREVAALFGVPRSSLPVVPDGINVPGLLGLTPMVSDLYYGEELYGKDIVALTPTRIVRRKNLEAGIKLTAAFKRAGKSIRWIITGAPDPHNADVMEYFKKLTTLRKKLGVRKEVIFMCEQSAERVSNEDLRALFSVADTLIFPSSQEGFGIPALEGGLAGLLMILSDIPALKEIAGKGAVYIRKGDKPDHVVRRALKAYAASPRFAFRKKMIAEYSWDSVFEKKIQPLVLHPKQFWK